MSKCQHAEVIKHYVSIPTLAPSGAKLRPYRAEKRMRSLSMFAEEKKPLWYNVRPYRQTAAEQLAYYVVFHADLDTELEWCQNKMYLFHYRQIKTHKKSKVWRSCFKITV